MVAIFDTINILTIHRRYGFATVLGFWLAQTGRSRHWNRPRVRLIAEESK